MTTKHGCAADVWDRSNLYAPSKCSFKGVVERDGVWFCKRHDPLAEKAKRAAANALRNAREAEQAAIRAEAERLAQILGCGRPHYKISFRTTAEANGWAREIVLTFDEVAALIAGREQP